MSMNTTKKFAMASAAATLLLTGYAQAEGEKTASEAKIHCGGVTSCKGTSDCKTAENSCKGQNGCKGEGFKRLTRAECDAKGGTEIK